MGKAIALLVSATFAASIAACVAEAPVEPPLQVEDAPADSSPAPPAAPALRPGMRTSLPPSSPPASPGAPMAPPAMSAGPAPTVASTTDNVRTAISYGGSLVGAPYGAWDGGPISAAAPMWASNGAPPAPSTVKAASVSSAGLANLVLRAVGKPLPTTPATGTGGTGAYASYYAAVAKPFDLTTKYPAGTLLGRRYRSSADQGHLAIVLANGLVLESFASVSGGTTPGVSTARTVAGSNAAAVFDYAVAPEAWLGAE